MELLFSGAVGAGITHILLQQMDKVKLEKLERMYRQACDYYDQNHYQQAVSMLLELVELDDTNPYYYVQLYFSYGKLAAKLATPENVKENSERAFECYDNIVRLDRQGISIPQDLLNHLEVFTTEMKGLYNKLLKTEKELQRIKNNQGLTQDTKAEDYHQKATLATEAGNHVEALQCITIAIESETDDSLIALYHIKRAFFKAFLGDDVGAIVDFNMALKCKRVDEESGGYFQAYARDLRKIDSLWRKELLSHSRAIRRKSGDSSSNICVLCGGSK